MIVIDFPHEKNASKNGEYFRLVTYKTHSHTHSHTHTHTHTHTHLHKHNNLQVKPEKLLKKLQMTILNVRHNMQYTVK